MRSALLILTFLTLLSTAYGHGDVHERIDIVTDEITQASDEASLRVKRARLYVEDGDYKNALEDLDSAAILAGDHYPPMLMTYAEMYHKLGSFDIALKYIDQFLEQEPIHVLGFREKADILREMGDLENAIAYYKKVILHTTTPLPENYMELMDLLESEERWTEAEFYGREALSTLGQLPVFELRLIDLLERGGQYDKALAMTDQLIGRYERKEKWYLRKAGIYRQMGNTSEEQRNLELSLASIARLPQRIQVTPAMRDLAAEINTALHQIKNPSHDLTSERPEN